VSALFPRESGPVRFILHLILNSRQPLDRHATLEWPSHSKNRADAGIFPVFWQSSQWKPCIVFGTWFACLAFLGVLMAPPLKRSGRTAIGKEVFEQCRGCHSAETDEKKVGPSLKGIFRRSRLRNGERVTEKAVREKIDLGGDGMPAYSGVLSENEKNCLIAYLKGR